MKWHAFSLISLLSLLLVAGSATAQTIHVRGDIPFDFIVGNKTLPAGVYDLGSLQMADALLIEADNRKSSMMVISNAAETFRPADKTKLVFRRHGDQYFLAEIWVKGSQLGRELPKTSREKEVARETAQDVTQQRVEIVASLY